MGFHWSVNLIDVSELKGENNDVKVEAKIVEPKVRVVKKVENIMEK